jgi:hypothetical protein
MAEEHKDNIEQDKPSDTGNALAEKRGRMVMAGVVIAVILSVIAVLVAAIFQLTVRLIAHCPADVKINDPAPILWKKMETPNLGDQSLGVAGKLLTEARFKGLAVPDDRGKEEAK